MGAFFKLTRCLITCAAGTGQEFFSNSPRTAKPCIDCSASDRWNACVKCGYCSSTRSQANCTAGNKIIAVHHIINTSRCNGNQRISSNWGVCNCSGRHRSDKLRCRSGAFATETINSSRQGSTSLKHFSNGGTALRAGQDHLGHPCAHGVILIGRQGNSRQDTNDGHHDHQFDQGKAFLNSTLHTKLQKIFGVSYQHVTCHYTKYVKLGLFANL